MTEGRLEVKIPTVCTDRKAEVGRVREEKRREEKGREGKGREEKRREERRREEKRRRKKTRRERVRGKKMQVCEKVEKPRDPVFFPMSPGSGGSKNRLAKAAGAEPSGEMRDEKLQAVLKPSCWKSARRCGAKHVSKSKL